MSNKEAAMNKKVAAALEWVGVGIILAGVALFAFIYFKKIVLSPLHYAILLWVLGFGILCYIPKSIIRYEDKKKEFKSLGTDDSEENKKILNSLRRSFLIRFICALALILYGVKIFVLPILNS